MEENSWMLVLLSTANLAHRGGLSPDELKALAPIYESDLADEEPEAVEMAFDLHRRQKNAFPTVADIFRILPECRRVGKPRLAAIEEHREPVPPEEIAAMMAAWKARNARALDDKPRDLARDVERLKALFGETGNGN